MGFKDVLKKGTTNVNGDGRIKELEDKIAGLECIKKATMYQFGCEYFERNRKMDVSRTDEFIKKFILEVNEVNEQIETLSKKKLFMEGMRMCERCKAILPANSMFCNRCGRKLEELSEEITGCYCKKCGYELEEESIFCPNCGKKVAE